MILFNVELFCLWDDGSGGGGLQIVKIRNSKDDGRCLFEHIYFELV
jgi:hypothetical protein